MARLTIHSAQDPTVVMSTTDKHAEIAAVLNTVGVYFDRWTTPAVLTLDATSEAVLAAYAKPIAYLRSARNYQHVDVTRVPHGAANAAEIREKFLSEHTHSDDEARFLVEGSGCFYLRVDDRVYAVECTAGNLILVPGGLRHWFDMGLDPHFTAVRLFTRPDGWVADLTGDPIADRFPAFIG